MATASATLSRHCKAQEEARKYLDTHNLERLFTQMINQMLFTKPTNPKVELILFLAERVPVAQLHENGISLQGVTGIRKSVMAPITEKFKPGGERISGIAEAIMQQKQSATGEEFLLQGIDEEATREEDGNTETLPQAIGGVSKEGEDGTQQPDVLLADAAKDEDMAKAAADRGGDGAGADGGGPGDGTGDTADDVNEVIAAADEGQEREDDPEEGEGVEKKDGAEAPAAAVGEDATAATDRAKGDAAKVEPSAEDEDKGAGHVTSRASNRIKAEKDTAEDTAKKLDAGEVVESPLLLSRSADLAEEANEDGDAHSSAGSGSKNAEKENEGGAKRKTLQTDSVDGDEDDSSNQSDEERTS
eukprot:GEMP01038051.1.p1 GENE.GEMP01038051.1~~GEMP01038051.1.p1  ORF type:complete len:369 (+),score=130.99 GEMP01038051.1:28-1107(+)